MDDWSLQIKVKVICQSEGHFKRSQTFYQLLIHSQSDRLHYKIRTDTCVQSISSDKSRHFDHIFIVFPMLLLTWLSLIGLSCKTCNKL